MIKFYGVFQLVRVIKEDKTKKGDTVVFLSAASRRTDKDSDFKLLKMFGDQADFFLRNLTKGNDGQYQSRKMMVEGYVETYSSNQDVACIAELTPSMIPQQIGLLKQGITVKAKTTIKVDKDTYVVKHFEFVDKPKDNGVEIILNGEMQNLGTQMAPTSNNSSVSDSSEIKQIANEKNKILNDGFKDFNDEEFVGNDIVSNT